jgi:hypothetical protein
MSSGFYVEFCIDNYCKLYFELTDCGSHRLVAIKYNKYPVYIEPAVIYGVWAP